MWLISESNLKDRRRLFFLDSKLLLSWCEEKEVATVEEENRAIFRNSYLTNYLSK